MYYCIQHQECLWREEVCTLLSSFVRLMVPCVTAVLCSTSQCDHLIGYYLIRYCLYASYNLVHLKHTKALITHTGIKIHIQESKLKMMLKGFTSSSFLKCSCAALYNLANKVNRAELQDRESEDQGREGLQRQIDWSREEWFCCFDSLEQEGQHLQSTVRKKTKGRERGRTDEQDRDQFLPIPWNRKYVMWLNVLYSTRIEHYLCEYQIWWWSCFLVDESQKRAVCAIKHLYQCHFAFNKNKAEIISDMAALTWHFFFFLHYNTHSALWRCIWMCIHSKPFSR